MPESCSTAIGCCALEPLYTHENTLCLQAYNVVHMHGIGPIKT